MIYLVGEDARSVPDWFRRRLRDIDTALVVYHNPFQNQFCIDRCVKGSECLSRDHISCEKTNVLMFPHMSEAALDKLKSMDAWTQTNAVSGNDSDALAKFRKAHENAKAEYDEKVREDSRKGYAEAVKDDRLAINRAKLLIERHDISRVH